MKRKKLKRTETSKRKRISKEQLREEIKKEICENCSAYKSGHTVCLIYETRGKCPLVFLDEILEIAFRILKKYKKL